MSIDGPIHLTYLKSMWYDVLLEQLCVCVGGGEVG